MSNRGRAFVDTRRIRHTNGQAAPSRPVRTKVSYGINNAKKAFGALCSRVRATPTPRAMLNIVAAILVATGAPGSATILADQLRGLRVKPRQERVAQAMLTTQTSDLLVYVTKVIDAAENKSPRPVHMDQPAHVLELLPDDWAIGSQPELGRICQALREQGRLTIDKNTKKQGREVAARLHFEGNGATFNDEILSSADEFDMGSSIAAEDFVAMLDAEEGTEASAYNCDIPTSETASAVSPPAAALGDKKITTNNLDTEASTPPSALGPKESPVRITPPVTPPPPSSVFLQPPVLQNIQVPKASQALPPLPPPLDSHAPPSPLSVTPPPPSNALGGMFSPPLDMAAVASVVGGMFSRGGVMPDPRKSASTLKGLRQGFVDAETMGRIIRGLRSAAGKKELERQQAGVKFVGPALGTPSHKTTTGMNRMINGMAAHHKVGAKFAVCVSTPGSSARASVITGVFIRAPSPGSPSAGAGGDTTTRRKSSTSSKPPAVLAAIHLERSGVAETVTVEEWVQRHGNSDGARLSAWVY